MEPLLACLMILVAVGFIGIYFMPTFVAIGHRHRQTEAIFFLNLLFGWTFLGWGLALVWSVTR